jgi:hypothetical protein
MTVSRAKQTAPASAADPLARPPRWQLRGRDLIALAAVGAAIWFAVQGPEGVPFRAASAPGTDQAPSANELVTTSIALDRSQLGSLPHSAAVQGNGVSSGDATAGTAGTVKGHKGGKGHGGGSGGPGGGGGTGGGSSDSGIAQVNVPGVGSVTLDPDLPDLPVQTPKLPPVNLPPLPGTGDLPQLPPLLP